MTEPGQTPQAPQPGAPAPGWYTDDHGLLRWWDGTQWTADVQMPGQMPPLTPQMPTPAPMTTGTGFGEKSFLPWIIALGAVLALSVVAVIIVGSAGSNDGNETDVVPSDQVQTVQSNLRSAQTAMETYAIDANGSYEGATPEALAAIEPTLQGQPLTVSGTATGYTLSAQAGDVTFTITRADGGVMTLTCDPPGGSGCDETGSWGLAA